MARFCVMLAFGAVVFRTLDVPATTATPGTHLHRTTTSARSRRDRPE